MHPLIQLACAKLSVTQKELARELGITKGCLSDLNCGVRDAAPVVQLAMECLVRRKEEGKEWRMSDIKVDIPTATRALGVTQRGLAPMLGLSIAYVSRLTGPNRPLLKRHQLAIECLLRRAGVWEKVVAARAPRRSDLLNLSVDQDMRNASYVVEPAKN